ncbi:MAG TPA: GNAT family N-acetyltransferase [Solirubrobacteraceae bacterium]|nr:GNAT family N-acetyltransferase [Solirubrobacteraceae bacterium]
MDLCALPDGRVVTIRPIRPDDRERLQLSHARLSELSRYRRFMSSKPVLTASDASYLVDIDGRSHYALVATVAEPAGEAIIAVARYVRLSADSDVAEFAVVVGDAWQRQGLGAELLGRLADAAVTRGVDRFYATILADNVAIRRLIDRLADGPVNRRREGNVLELDFPLPTRGDVEPPSRGAPAMIAACAGS